MAVHNHDIVPNDIYAVINMNVLPEAPDEITEVLKSMPEIPWSAMISRQCAIIILAQFHSMEILNQFLHKKLTMMKVCLNIFQRETSFFCR